MTYDFVSRDYPLKKELFLTDATDPKKTIVLPISEIKKIEIHLKHLHL